MTKILLIILIAFAGIALLTLLLQLFKVRVRVYAQGRRTRNLQCIGMLTLKNEDEVPEVRLPDKMKGPAIGRIKIGENRDDNAYVELLLTDSDDDSVKPKYRVYGFISQDGYIYKMGQKDRKPQKIGYTARPSAPDSPTVVGEKSWKTLWLRSTLNAYMGVPDDKATAQDEMTENPAEETEGKKNKTDRKRDKKRSAAKPRAAYATYTGIHSSAGDAMPPEARAAAFGVIYNLFNKNDYQEHYGSPVYGWKDTALPAAFIYAILYTVWYIVNVKVLGLRFVGYKFWQDIPLYFAYYAIWVIVRAVKIECIERSDTIQPKIDLFNKVVGQRGFDLMILGCCVVTLAFSGTYYRFDFIPLAAVLLSAIGINLSLRSSTKPWKTINPFVEDEEDKEGEELENPRGDIERFYQWELETSKDVKGELTLYYDAQYIRDLRYMNPFFNQRKEKSTSAQIRDMFKYVASHSSVSARSRYIARRIKEIARQKGLAEEDSLQFLLDFVQEPNIRFVMNRESDAIQGFEDYIRYPDEILYDKEGDSNSKAFLAAVLIHYFGYNVVFLCSRLQKHGAVGIEVSPEWVSNGYLFGRKADEVTFEYNGRRYIFCETSADGFRIGGALDGMKPEDFDEKVEIPLIPQDADISNEESKTCLYNWDLDEKRGNRLHGTYTLEFTHDEMEALREKNPFLQYGIDGCTYEDNVRAMFGYLDADSDRKRKVREIATYIKSTVTQAGLDEAEMVQFALDFCQMPNITYKIDEDSSGINYNDVSKEYMRFPDEVLYDKEGDCDCKSSLTIALFRELGYKTLFMMSKKYSHAAVGVEYKPVLRNILGIDDPAVVRHHNGTDYLYCETTGDGFRIGQIKEGDTIQEFDSVVEIS